MHNYLLEYYKNYVKVKILKYLRNIFHRDFSKRLKDRNKKNRKKEKSKNNRINKNKK